MNYINRVCGLFILFALCVNTSAFAVERHKNLSYAGTQISVLPRLVLKKAISTENIIFLHIPKVAGTNVVFLAEASGKLGSGIKAFRFPVPRVPGRSPNFIDHGWIGGLKSAMVKLGKDPDCCHGKNFISGHFPFGLHEMLDSEQKYIALIRDPIEREISAVNFDYQRGYLERKQAQDYLLNKMIDNPQTRMLAGKSYMAGVCTEETLQKAKTNIENHFLIVGISEEVNTFVQALAALKNLGPVGIVKTQVTKIKALDVPSDNLKYHLSQKHKFDLQLYSWVKENWQNWKIQNIEKEIKVADNDKITVIDAEYAYSRKPHKMNLSEIMLHNKETSQSPLKEITQNHTELKNDTHSKRR